MANRFVLLVVKKRYSRKTMTVSQNLKSLKQFQEKCHAVFRAELRKNKHLERSAIL